MIDKCLKNQSFKLSKGEQLRDFCHISDIASGILSILENKKTFGEVINLGSGQPISIKEIVQMISRQIGKGNPEFGKIPYRKGENMCLYADISKAKQLMNWKPLVSLEEGLKKLYFILRMRLTNNNKPLVSIINCLNGEKYLKEAINSVYKQSYKIGK